MFILGVLLPCSLRARAECNLFIWNQFFNFAWQSDGCNAAEEMATPPPPPVSFTYFNLNDSTMWNVSSSFPIFCHSFFRICILFFVALVNGEFRYCRCRRRCPYCCCCWLIRLNSIIICTHQRCDPRTEGARSCSDTNRMELKCVETKNVLRLRILSVCACMSCHRNRNNHFSRLFLSVLRTKNLIDREYYSHTHTIRNAFLADGWVCCASRCIAFPIRCGVVNSIPISNAYVPFSLTQGRSSIFNWVN